MRFLWLLAVVPCTLAWSAPPEQVTIRVPASTAYLEPDRGGIRLSRERGITNWTEPETRICWFGQFPTNGQLQASLVLRFPSTESASRLKLTIDGQSRELTIQPTNAESIQAAFGSFTITRTGYHRIQLESLNQPGRSAGDVEALLLQGPAVRRAHFNLKPRRNAASVHLFYPLPADTRVAAFYCEMTGLEDPLWTYYMACGWHRGYFGMQVNSPTERRIIFSVWDSGHEAIDRAKVAEEDRVQLVAKGPDVHAGDFGNEGTGGHSHWKYHWKTGETQRFLVTAEPVDATHTVFSGYYFRPDRNEWMLISSWKAPKEGGYLRGLYSFSENFSGRNGHLLRKASYGQQWIRTDQGEWLELTQAKFSHDGTGKEDRLDRFMGLEAGQFFLSHGGFVDGFTEYGTLFERPATHRSPASMTLPPLPEVSKE